MKNLFLVIFIVFLFVGNIFSQKIGIVYNTDEYVEFAYLRGVAYRIENEYKLDLNVIDYCENAIKNESFEVTRIDVRPSSMAYLSQKSNAKRICEENELDYIITLIHMPMHPDQFASIQYKMRHKSFSIFVSNLSKKIYYVSFLAEFHLYSKAANEFTSTYDRIPYKTFEYFTGNTNVVEKEILVDSIMNDGLIKIKEKLDISLNVIIQAIKNQK